DGGPGPGLVDVAADDRRAGGREHVRGRLADPARDAGQHRDLARQVEKLLHACHETPLGRSGENRSGAYAPTRDGARRGMANLVDGSESAGPSPVVARVRRPRDGSPTMFT